MIYCISPSRMSIIRVVCVKDGIVSAQNTHKNEFFAVSLFTRGIE